MVERLTEKHYLGTDHYMKCSENCDVDMGCIDCPSFDRLVERLAAYEDTGLTPEEVLPKDKADEIAMKLMRPRWCGAKTASIGLNRATVDIRATTGFYHRHIHTTFAFTENGGTMIKDSGERTKFPSGALRDMHTGKGRMDLLPWSAIMEVSKHCEAGALKYGEHNVDKGIPTHSLLDSAIRHAAKYLAGYVDEPHLVAAAWNLLWAIEMEIVHPECVDTPWRASDGE